MKVPAQHFTLSGDFYVCLCTLRQRFVCLVSTAVFPIRPQPAFYAWLLFFLGLLNRVKWIKRNSDYTWKDEFLFDLGSSFDSRLGAVYVVRCEHTAIMLRRKRSHYFESAWKRMALVCLQEISSVIRLQWKSHPALIRPPLQGVNRAWCIFCIAGSNKRTAKLACNVAERMPEGRA